MKYENHVETDGIEYCDNTFFCITGAMGVDGLHFDLEGGPDWIDAIIIGAIDAPEHLPAGGWKFSDDFLGAYIEQQMVRREQ